jgi:hypothetical protein
LHHTIEQRRRHGLQRNVVIGVMVAKRHQLGVADLRVQGADRLGQTQADDALDGQIMHNSNPSVSTPHASIQQSDQWNRGCRPNRKSAACNQMGALNRSTVLAHISSTGACG